VHVWHCIQLYLPRTEISHITGASHDPIQQMQRYNTKKSTRSRINRKPSPHSISLRHKTTLLPHTQKIQRRTQSNHIKINTYVTRRMPRYVSQT